MIAEKRKHVFSLLLLKPFAVCRPAKVAMDQNRSRAAPKKARATV